jgi:hypothetical protein
MMRAQPDVGPTLGLYLTTYPSWQFDRETKLPEVRFSWARPEMVDKTSPLRLRLFWSAPDIADKGQWQVDWRWVTALEPGTPALGPQSSLGAPLEPASPHTQSFTIETPPQQLQVTKPFALKPIEYEVGDYIVFRVRLTKQPGVDVHLLLAELTW